MCKKVLRIAMNFYKTAKLSELIELILIPFFILIIVIFSVSKDMKVMLEFAKSFTDSVISIVSLLAAFGIASVTILLTSSSNNIQEAKEYYTKRKDLNGKNITYFQLLLIRNFYSLISQLTLLLIAIIIKVLFLKSSSGYEYLYIEITLLTHILLMQFLSITSVYHLLWKEKN